MTTLQDKLDALLDRENEEYIDEFETFCQQLVTDYDGVADRFIATSSSTQTVGPGDKTFTLSATGKSFAVNSYVMAYKTSDPAVYMIGQVTAFSDPALTISVAAGDYAGSGSVSAWTIALAAKPPAVGSQTVVATGSTATRNLADRFADVIQAKDYSVTANGSTDDTTALQAAINAASAVKGTLILPPGTLKVSGTLTISAEITVRGSVYGTKLRTTSATLPILSIEDVPNDPGCTIDGITFTSSVTRTAGAYIVSDNAQGTTIKNCRFDDPYDGIYVTGPAVQSLTIRDCVLNGVSHYGIKIDASTNGGGPAMQGIVWSHITDVLVAGSPSQDAAAGIYMTSVGDLTVAGVGTVYCDIGCNVAPRSAAASGLAFKETIQLLTIRDCSFDTGGSYGVSIGGSGEVRNVILDNVWAGSNGVHGIAFRGTGAIHHVDVIGASAVNNSSAGLAVENSATGTVKLIGGCYAGNTGSGVGASYGTIVVSGVHTGSTDGAGVAFGPNGGYGLYFAGSSSYIVSGVSFGTNTAGNFLDDGATGSVKSISGSPGTGKTLYTTGSATITGPAGNNWSIGPVATTAHAAGNVCTVGLTVTDGAAAAGVFVQNTHNGTYSSQRISLKSAQGGVVGTTERFAIEPNGVITNGTSTLFDAAGIARLRPFTVGTLPSASPAYQQIAVSDGTSNKRLAISDGTNWRWPDGATVT